MATARRNARYLPDLALPESLQFSGALEPTVRDAGTVLIAVPSHAFGELLDASRRGSRRTPASHGRPRVSIRHPAASCTSSSPSACRSIAGRRRDRALRSRAKSRSGLPTAVTVHSADAAIRASSVAHMLHSPLFRAYTGNDVIGAELGGAMKNVLAVATGVADGMQMGLNARAGLITRGIAEMMRLGAAIGARAETLMGLAGLGDLVLTCTGDLSRNRRLGLALGRGVPLAQAVAEIGQVVESVQTVDTVMRLAEAHGRRAADHVARAARAARGAVAGRRRCGRCCRASRSRSIRRLFCATRRSRRCREKMLTFPPNRGTQGSFFKKLKSPRAGFSLFRE